MSNNKTIRNEGRTAQVIGQSLAWAQEPETGRRVSVGIDRTWTKDAGLSIYVSENQIGAYLPENFIGDISKYICEHNQEELTKEIESKQKQLEEISQRCNEL